jgi:predicted negative regulator of RcsB-dependent stress response
MTDPALSGSEIARLLGSIRTQKKTESSRKTLSEARESRWTPEARKRHGDAVRAAAQRRAEAKKSSTILPETP